jgi:tetratricopeptide (TPR) repeat protein
MAKVTEPRPLGSGVAPRSLRRFLGDQPIQARRPSAAERLGRWARRHRSAVGAALAALLLTVLALAVTTVVVVREKGHTQEALGQANRNFAEADRQRQRAEANSRRAWQAVDDMYTQVAEKWLAHEPGMRDVQREFLEKALRVYEDLAREEGEGPEHLLERAKANRRSGAILNKLERRAEAEAAYRRGILLLEGADIPGKAAELADTYSLLGIFLRAAVRNAEAESALHRALTHWESVPADEAARPEVRLGRAKTFSRLAMHLATTGRAAESESFFREGLPLIRGLVTEFPRESRYHSELGGMLNDYGLARFAQGDPVRACEYTTEAIAHQEEAVKLAPRDPGNRLYLRNHYATLAVGPLLALKRYPDALAAARKSLAVTERLASDFPDVPHYRRCLADAYTDLGQVLRGSGRVPEAEEAYTEAIRIQERVLTADPNSPRDRKQACSIYAELADLRRAAGRGREAVGAYRRAVELGSESAEVHRNLGIALADQGEAVEAEAAFRRAIELCPDFSGAYNSLAIALGAQGKWADAEEACRRAIALDLDFPEARNSLGVALREQGKLTEAVAAFRRVIELRPDCIPPYFNLADTLRRQGHFQESLAEFRRGHRLGTKQPGWSLPSAECVREAEEIIALDEKLPAVMKGQARPSDLREMLRLAQVAQFRGWCAASAKLYSDAFALDPKIAQTPDNHLYDAARAAALAGVGRGVDAPSTPEKLRSDLRRQALAWLRADLKARFGSLDGEPNKTRTEVAKEMRRWQQDKDFAVVREPEALGRLPAAEQQTWQNLWADVADTLARARGTTAPDMKAGNKVLPPER